MTISAPGKMMLSGEWAVLEGHPCLALAVDVRMKIKIESSSQITIHSPEFGLDDLALGSDKASSEIKKHLPFIEAPINEALKYLKGQSIEAKPFRLEVLENIPLIENEKIGFGSSAALVVSIVAAVLQFHGLAIDSIPEKIFQLAQAAHFAAQGKQGSGFDIAASVFGGLFKYQKPDKIQSLTWPENFHLLVGYVGYSASTRELVEKMKSCRENDANNYQAIMKKIGATVLDVENCLAQNNFSDFKKNIKANRNLLQQLTKLSGMSLETKELKALADIAESHGAVAKFSGAGGGDIGLAVTDDKQVIKKIKSDWEKAGITPLDVKIAQSGVRVDKA